MIDAPVHDMTPTGNSVVLLLTITIARDATSVNERAQPGARQPRGHALGSYMYAAEPKPPFHTIVARDIYSHGHPHSISQ